MSKLNYQSGFGNEFTTEARSGELPIGQNSPQKHPLGLYAEQVSGSAFTAPRGMNRRTWMYRIRPSVVHEPYKLFRLQTLLRSGPFDELPTPPNQMRWTPPDFPLSQTDSLRGFDNRRKRRSRES
jgi:homogentisate 1,2-dioxygenase